MHTNTQYDLFTEPVPLAASAATHNLAASAAPTPYNPDTVCYFTDPPCQKLRQQYAQTPAYPLPSTAFASHKHHNLY